MAILARSVSQRKTRQQDGNRNTKKPASCSRAIVLCDHMRHCQYCLDPPYLHRHPWSCHTCTDGQNFPSFFCVVRFPFDLPSFLCLGFTTLRNTILDRNGKIVGLLYIACPQCVLSRTRGSQQMDLTRTNSKEEEANTLDVSTVAFSPSELRGQGPLQSLHVRLSGPYVYLMRDI